MSGGSTFLKELQKRGVNTPESTAVSAGGAGGGFLEELNKLKKKEKELDKASLSNDIAPVKEEKEEEGLDFFDAGSFSDGYQMWDVSKAILGTVGDVGHGILKGGVGMVEGLTDLATYGAAGISGLFGADELSEKLKHAAKADFTGDTFKRGEEFLDKYSLLGDTSNAVAQGVGQVGTIILTGGAAGAAGLSSAGVSAVTTAAMGLSGMGSGMGEAYKGGATDGEAVAYGAMAGAADAVTELIFGGLGKGINALGFSKGLSSADDILAKTLSSKIQSVLGKNLVEFGVKAGAEGLEEVLAGTAQAAAKQATYMSEKDFADIIKDENLLEQFVVGALTSGIAQGGDVYKATKAGKDLVTGFTKNEQAVVKKEIEKRIAEREKGGKKLTAKEKSAIEAQVEEDMEKGNISIDTIEEVLGGDSYKTYKETIDNETSLKEQQKALQTEYDELYKMEIGKKSDEQVDRQAQLKSEIEEIQAKLDDTERISQRDMLKAQLDKDVFEVSKSDRLKESFFEKVRENQKYETDLNKYTGKAREVIQQVMDSGLADNTNKTHEFWDLVAGLAERSDRNISLASNEQILEMVKAEHEAKGIEFDASKFEGQLIDGYVSENGIVLNAETKRALSWVVGHELTHTLEKSKHYDKLQKLLFEFAKGEYDNRFNARKGQYSNKFDADENFKKRVDREVTGDLVGDYIFNDKAFIEHLAKDRNVFQKVFDEIKYMAKIATAGSEQARELERVKREFERAWRDNVNGVDGTKFSLENGNKRKYNKRSRYSETETLFLSWENGSAPIGEVKSFVRYGKIHYYEKTENGCVELSRSQYNERNGFNAERIDRRAEHRIGATADYDESTQRGSSGDSDSHRDAYGNVAVFGQAISEKLRNEFTGSESGTVGYGSRNDISQSEYNDEASGKPGASFVTFSNDYATIRNFMKEGDTGDSDIQYSLSSDSTGKQLSKEQQEYFKDSKVRDENGNLKVMYHGTSKGGHTVFDTYGSNYGLFGQGSYFTDSKTIAESYTKKGKGNNPQVYETYLNIKNPIDMDAQADPAAWQKAFPEASFPDSGTNEDFYRAMEEYLEDQMLPKWEAAEWAMDAIYGMGYDGITHIGGGRVNPNGERHQVYIAFDPEQIKNADNAKPTNNPDIRYSLSPVEDVQPKSDLWHRTATTEEAMAQFPNMWNVAAEESEVRNPTQITTTVKSYRKIYNYLQDEGFNGTILDASSGLGYGTKAGIEEFGFDVEDIEPYPDKGYKPKYTDYSALDKKYDAIISNAVLNVLPQDQRDALVVKMGELLNDGGRMFINVRGKDVETLANTGKNIHLGNMEWIETVKGSYQKGFTKDELKAYLEDALGDGFTVEKTNMFGAVSAIVTKEVAHQKPTGDSDIRYSLSEQENAYQYNLDRGDMLGAEMAVEEYANIAMPDSKIRDKNGRLIPVYHGTKEMFYEFDTSVNGAKNGTAEGFGIYLSDDQEVTEAYGDRQIKMYANITKPATSFDKTISQNTLVKLIKNTCEKEAQQMVSDGEHDNVKDAIRDTWISNYVYTYGISMDQAYREVAQLFLKQNSSDMDIVQEVMFGMAIRNYDQAMKFYHDSLTPITGIDGFITKWENAGKTSNIYLAFDSSQLKSADAVTKDDSGNVIPLSERFNPDNKDIRYSISDIGQEHKNTGGYQYYSHIPGSDIAPVSQTENATETPKTEQNVPITENVDLFPDDLSPVQTELDNLNQQKETLESRMLEAINSEDLDSFYQINTEYESVMERIKELESEVAETESDRVNSLTDADAPPEMDAPYYGTADNTRVENPFDDRNWYDVGKRNVNAYMYENPEVKPFFQEEALKMMGELRDTVKGERFFDAQVYYDSGGEKGITGVKRHTSNSLAEVLDSWHMSYADIEKGLTAIIEDNGAENIAAAKKLEFMLNDRLLNGYQDFYSNSRIPANQDYINLLNERQINEYSKEAFDSFMETADQYAPVAEENTVTEEAPVAEEYEAITPERNQRKEPRMVRVDNAQQNAEPPKVAEVLADEPKTESRRIRAWSKFVKIFGDKGNVFETLSLKTKNRELQARFNSIYYAEGRAQKLIGEGTNGVKALNDIIAEVEKTGKTKKFYEYLYHLHNVDRMSLEGRYKDTPNKAVFGDTVTADMSRMMATELAKENPEFRSWSQDVYRFNNHLRQLLVDGGVISQETADLWAEMYPHYVPIRRAGDDGLNINVPLDTGKTGVNAPIKRATGGSRDILPLFDTMAQRTLQTYKAIAKNRFGVELKNTLGTTVAKEATSVDGVIDSVDQHEGLLQEGKNGKAPTFTVFENGEKVTFEITEDMYDALKPTSDGLAYTNKVLNGISNFQRGLLTEYNPTFILTNSIKDAQDVLINSQHAIKTYATFPKAIKELVSKGKWYTEYMENGGEQNTYFDKDTNTFEKEKSTFVKTIGFPLEAISTANNFIERLPRLAEYIASRESGRSIDVSMLDAARVTTNFAAGGDVTKFLNRNGATFLNASVQGFMQNVRNVREAKANGLKGVGVLAAKVAAVGLSGLLLNNLLWDDDEEYEELSDYVKQNYYVVGKYGDGQFVRIPKGRMMAVIQNAFDQMQNMITGNDEVDLQTFGELFISNLAPNNPLDNNIFSPIIQAATNTTWYGDDLVPTSLQDQPAAEQYDETTDSISKWLGEKLDVSPYKINYLLDQYSGGVGDTFLPMLTPAAERGDDSLAGNIIAPLKDKFTTDSVLKNQNVSDFYDLKDKLAVNANASDATDDDVLKSKYINSVSSELNELYKQKREIQNSNKSDSEKYRLVRNIQSQIASLTKGALDAYEDVRYENGEYAVIGDKYFQWYTPEEGDPYWRKLTASQTTKYLVTSAAGDANYATDGSVHYRRDEDGEWTKISDKQLARQNEVTKRLGITPEEYWSETEISFMPMSNGKYEYAYDNPENYAIAKAVGGYDSYKKYSNELYNIKADKDKNGKSISGSRKEKVVEYINNLDADYGEKIILYKSEYPSDDTYNAEIVEYLNGRKDISYEEIVTILKKLGFTVSSDGTVTWD